MYSSLYFKAIGVQTRLCNLFGSCPIDWDSKKQIFVYQKRNKLKQFYCSLGATFFGTAFYVVRALQTKLWGHPQDFGFLMTLGICGVSNSLGFLIFALNGEECVTYFNALFIYSKHFKVYWKKSFCPEKSLYSKLLEIFVLSCLFLNFECPWFVSAHYFMYPKFPAYAFSMLPDHLFNSYSYIISGLIYVGFLHAIFGNFILLLNMGLTLVVLIVSILPNEFMGCSRVDVDHFYKSTYRLRSPRKLFIEYRAMELLLMRTNAVFGPLIIPFQAIITNLCLFSNYTLIREWEQLDKTTGTILLFWSVSYLLAWMTLLRFGGWLKNGGKKILRSWNYLQWSSAGDRKVLKKQRKGCRVYALRVGCYRCIGSLSVLKFLKGIVRGTFRALLLTTNKT